MSDSDFSNSSQPAEEDQASESSKSGDAINIYSSSEEAGEEDAAAAEDPMDMDEEEGEQEKPEQAPPDEPEKKKDLFELLRVCVPQEFQHYIGSTQRSVEEVRQLGRQFDSRVKEATVLLSEDEIKF